MKKGRDDPKDAVEHAPVIHTRDAARLVRQERPDGRPFVIGEFVAHDSRLRLVSLNHGRGAGSTCHAKCEGASRSLSPQKRTRYAHLSSSGYDSTRALASLSCCSREADFSPSKTLF